MTRKLPLAVTIGDPRGIGPEVIAAALQREGWGAGLPADPPEVLLFGDEASLAPFAGKGFETRAVGRFEGSLASAGAVSLDAIRAGVEAIGRGEATALVTGSVHKPAFRAAGYEGAGQTELLQELTGAPAVGMLMHARATGLGASPLRILLATTHVALRCVPALLTRELLLSQLLLLDRELRGRWQIQHPRIGLCGLNPHASDGGLFGDEEARVMAPAIEEARKAGVDARGPFPADTVFLRAVDGDLDVIVAPYHDVGMAVFKTLGFGRGVNTTLGLPFVRTSPDHGTAFDIVGTGRARADSTREALELARTLSAAI